jgi:hypothetical protein
MPAVATSKGGRRWRKVEDAVVRKTYPDYGLMRLRLPCRSLAALKRRATILGVVKCRHVWMQTEVRRLSRLVEANTSNADLAPAFPHLRLAQITAKIRHLGLPRRRPQLVDFAEAAIGKVRQRAVEKGLSLRDLDRLARTKRYFQQSTRRLNLEYVARAAVVLGGEIRIEWDDV